MSESSFLDQLAKERSHRAAEFLHEFYMLKLPENVTCCHFSFMLRYDDGNIASIGGTIEHAEKSEQVEKRGWFRWWMVFALTAWCGVGALLLPPLPSPSTAFIAYIATGITACYFMKYYMEDR